MNHPFVYFNAELLVIKLSFYDDSILLCVARMFVLLCPSLLLDTRTQWLISSTASEVRLCLIQKVYAIFAWLVSEEGYFVPSTRFLVSMTPAKHVCSLCTDGPSQAWSHLV